MTSDRTDPDLPVASSLLACLRSCCSINSFQQPLIAAVTVPSPTLAPYRVCGTCLIGQPVQPPRGSLIMAATKEATLVLEARYRALVHRKSNLIDSGYLPIRGVSIRRCPPGS
jgi:hypothetical protein